MVRVMNESPYAISPCAQLADSGVVWGIYGGTLTLLNRKSEYPWGFADAKDGGAVEGRTHKDIEKQNGQPVISKECFKKLAVKCRKKLNLNEIRTMKVDEVLIVSGNQDLIKIPSRAYFDVSKIKRATDTTRYPSMPVEAGRAGDGVYVPL